MPAADALAEKSHASADRDERRQKIRHARFHHARVRDQIRLDVRSDDDWAAALADFAARGWLKLEARAVLLLDVERLRRRSR